MGALHAGHIALVERAHASCASIAASVFVNPLQFGPLEDYDRYPRRLEDDRAALERARVDLLFAPSRNALYPDEFATRVYAGAIGERFEGALRPGHFDGVATVVAKLLHIVTPDVLYVGQKDAQQAAVLQRVVRDLDFPVRIEVVETVREPDGLALSSRNAYLSPQERASAPTLYRALVALRDALAGGEPKDAAVARARATLAPAARSEYFDVVDAHTFAPIASLEPPAFVIGAACFGRTRLIDNLWVRS